MKLYSARDPAPNPRRVRLFAAEKGIALDQVMLDLLKLEHKSADHLARNSLGQVPVLEVELDDGGGKTYLTETVAICRYLDALHPDKAPHLFGRTPLEQAKVDMWIRRVEFRIGEPIKHFWVHGHPATAKLLVQHRPYGKSNRAVLARAVAWLDGELADGRRWLAGDGDDSFSMADIAAVTFLDFAKLIGLDPLGDEASGPKNVRAWYARVTARPAFVPQGPSPSL